MKAVKLTAYRIPARQIAEMSWGTGGTTSYKTNRHGAYYYSCSGHGGYIVDGRCLTEPEKAAIDKLESPVNVRLLVQNGDVIAVSLLNIPRSGRFLKSQSSFRYNPSHGVPEWQDVPVYMFEEDCDWSILEKLTDIRTEAYTAIPSEHQQHIDNAFNSILAYKNKES